MHRRVAKRLFLWLRSKRRLERFLNRWTALRGEGTLYEHRLIMPNATYSPWYGDAQFQAVYERILENTFVDQYRCFELWEQLGQLTSIPGDILEVGVWRGGTGVLLSSCVEHREFRIIQFVRKIVRRGVGDVRRAARLRK